MHTSRKFLWGSIAVALLAVALFYATPYFTLFRMYRAVERSDADVVSRHVDFDALRENVRAKVTSEITRNAPQGAMAGLGQAIIADQIVGIFVQITRGQGHRTARTAIALQEHRILPAGGA